MDFLRIYKRSRWIIITVLLFSFKQENKDIVLWQSNRLLTWDDFRGKPQPRFAAASTSYDILKSISRKGNNAATVKIEAVFFCKDSWKKKEWINESVLVHEQKHFDIVELFARKLRKRIKEERYASFQNLENRLDELYKLNDKEMDAYQDLYDEKTDGSMDGGRQREWNKKIIDEIASYNKFEGTDVEVFIKAD